MLANSLTELDRAHLVHPVASWRGHEAAGVRLLTSAKGASVTDAEGRTLVDGFAGLWCVNAGYGQESVIAAAERQLRVLPYATGYFGLGSGPRENDPMLKVLDREFRPRRPGARLTREETAHARKFACRA